MKVACGFAHAGVALHEVVIDELVDGGHEALDLGAADDYPVICLLYTSIAVRDQPRQ